MADSGKNGPMAIGQVGLIMNKIRVYILLRGNGRYYTGSTNDLGEIAAASTRIGESRAKCLTSSLSIFSGMRNIKTSEAIGVSDKKEKE